MSSTLLLSQDDLAAAHENSDVQDTNGSEVYIVTQFVQDQVARMKSEQVKNAAECESTLQTRSMRRSERNENKKNDQSQSTRTREFKSSDSSLLEIRSCPSDNVVAHSKDEDDAIYWSSSHYSQYAEEVKERQQELRSEPPEQLGSMHDKKPCKELSAGHSLKTELLIAKSSRYVKPFEKPARRPMREDRDFKRKKASGVLAKEKRSKKKSKVDVRNPGGVGRTNDGKKSYRKKTSKSKPIASLVSTLSNITEGIASSRLTLPHRISAGIFNHGRQAGNRPRLGVPDLTFTRIDKLTEPSKSSVTARHEKAVLNVEAKKCSLFHDYSDYKNLESMENASTVNTTKSIKDFLSVSQPIADVAEILDAKCKELSSRVANRTHQHSFDQNSIISPQPIHVHEKKALATLEENVKDQNHTVGNAQISKVSQLAASVLENTPSVTIIEGACIAPHPNEISRRVKECTTHNSTWKKDTPLPQAESHLQNISPRQTYKSAHANESRYHQGDNVYYAGETPSHVYHYQALMHPVSAKNEHYENDADYPFHEKSAEGNYYCGTADDFDPSIPAIQIYDGRDDISGRDFRDYRRNPERGEYGLVENNRADETYINDESSIPGVSTSAYYGQHILNADSGSMSFDQYINNDYQYVLTDTSMTTFDLSVSDIQPVGSTGESEERFRLPPSSYSFGSQSDTVMNMYHIDSPQPPKFKRHRLF
ncbi:uncharacterized protein V1513DRAFT_427410 [Lipomyces chichibuensis]|uniref:uncharacterized protein n=1 Tax=Lipomyces chichibuensis TaxID=1546026 RepID=UPI00334391FF